MANCMVHRASILLFNTAFCTKITHKLEVYCSPKPGRWRNWPSVMPTILDGMTSIFALDNDIPHHAFHIFRKPGVVHHLRDVLASEE